MGMRPIDIIAIAGKTQDATQTQQANVRAHGTYQDQIALQQATRAEHDAHQVNATAPEDRLELSADGEAPSGNAGGGDDTHEEPAEVPEDVETAALPDEHINFLA